MATRGPELPESGALFGAFVAVGERNGPDQMMATLNFESVVGRKMAVDRQSFAWDQEWPGKYEAWSRDQGRTLYFDWVPTLIDGTVVRWADIAAGMYDDLLDARAEGVKEFGAPAFFTFGHEPEEAPGGTPQEFIQAYRHIYDHFQARGVTNLSHAWVLLAYTFRQEDPDVYYPGDRYVDVLGADGYNWYGCPGRGDLWRSFEFVFEDFYLYGIERGKPMMIAEVGSHEDDADPGRKAEWIAEASTTLQDWPELKAISWYHNGQPGANCDWWIDSSESALNAFIAMGSQRYFNPAPPLVTITSGPPIMDVSDSATFAFEANVPRSTFTCSLDGLLTLACSSGQTFDGLAEGLHTMRITATDPLTELSGYTTHEWTVDTVAPVLTIERGPADFVPESDATFHVVSSEPLEPGSLTCRLDAGPSEECEPWTTYEGLSDGLHTFRVTAADEAGNRSEPQLWTWTVDTVLPTVTITGGPDALSNSRSPTFTFSSEDPDATFKCSRDDGGYVDCTSPKTYNALEDGPHTFTVMAVDLAGNASVPAAWAWMIDASPPETTILFGPPDPDRDPSAILAFRADELGVIYTCSLDGEEPRACVSPAVYLVALGDHEFTVYATDLAGNSGNVAVWRWTRIGAAPGGGPV